MQPTYSLGGVPPGAQQLLHWILVTEGAAESAKIMIIVGQQMSTPQVVKLDAMLKRAQESICQSEPFAILTSHIAVVDQGLQRGQGGSGAQSLVYPAMYQLQQLDGELDVAQAALPQLELPTLITCRDMCHDPLAHALGIGDEVPPLRGSPDHRRYKINKGLPQLQITSSRSGLEHRLKLPGFGPFLVVDAMAGQGAHQLAGLALWPQGRIHLPDGSGRCMGRTDPRHLSSHPSGDLHGLIIA